MYRVKINNKFFFVCPNHIKKFIKKSFNLVDNISAPKLITDSEDWDECIVCKFIRTIYWMRETGSAVYSVVKKTAAKELYLEDD